MNGLGKLMLAAAVAVAAAGLLVVLTVGARHRANVSHCRNNLRWLGGLAVTNWPNLDPARTGRDFWQNVRETAYLIQGGRDKGKWKAPYAGLKWRTDTAPTDPFLCPVFGRTTTDPTTRECIDYLGPSSVPEELRQLPKDRALGADRPGNHPSGGHVLRLDTSVDPILPIVDGTASVAGLKE